MHHLIHNLNQWLERNGNPSKHIITLIFQQLTVSRIRVSDSSMDLSLDAGKIQSGIEDQDRMVCLISIFAIDGGCGGELTPDTG